MSDARLMRLPSDDEARLAAETWALVRLNEVSSRLWRTRDLREGLNAMLDASIELLGADMGNIQLLDPERNVLVIAAQRGFGQDFLDFFREVSAEDGSACGRALRMGGRIVIEDVEAEASFASFCAIARAAGFRAVQSTPLVGQDGAPRGMISTHFRSAHRPSEQDLQRLDLYALQAAEFIERCSADQALRERERELQSLAAIVESSDDAIVSTTLDGIIKSWNRAAEVTFGYTAVEMVGDSIFRLAGPGGEPEMAAILERIGRGERIEHFETQRRHKDGTILDISLTESPVYDEQGSLVGASKVSRDISTTKRAEAALSVSETRLQELNAELLHVSRLSAMGQMATMVAHELTQPLTAIGNYTQAARALLGRGAPVNRAQELLTRAEQQALRAGQIIQRLRGFVSQGDNEKRVESVSALMREAAELARVGTKYRGMDISIDDRATGSTVLADKIQLQQVLFNLLRNAAEAVDDQEQRQIGLVAEAVGDTIAISVIDNGPGLPQEVAERLFQPFVSTKKTGMGVGLSICKSIVDAHDGRIWAEPNPAGGTIFRITLPTASSE